MWTIATAFIDRGDVVIDYWLRGFDALDIDRKQTRCVWLDTTKDGVMKKHYLKRKKMFMEFEYLHYTKAIPAFAECHTLHPNNILTKRKSIEENTNKLMSMTKGDVMLLEDDIVVPSNAFRVLLEQFYYSCVDAVTCLQISRSNPGHMDALVWDFQDGTKVFPGEDTSSEVYPMSLAVFVNRIGKGIEVIDASATGFILYKENFVKYHNFKCCGFRGQDIGVGLKIRERNNVLLINWDVWAEHFEERDGGLLIFRPDGLKQIHL